MSSWFPGGGGLTFSDYAVFVLLLGGMTALGWKTGGSVDDADGFFVGRRRLPWAAAGLGLVAAEVSVLTVIGLPAAAFREDWTYLQFFAGAAAARALVALVLVPLFFKSGATTPYEWLGSRFGPWTRSAAAGAFVVTRLLGSSVRLLAACVAAGVLLGWGPWPTLALFTAVALLGLARGGVTAAVWTGVFQTAVIILVGVLSILFLFRRVDGGLGGVWSLAGMAGKLRIADLGGSPLTPGYLARFFGEPPVFWGALLTGFVGSAAAFGTDHEQTQKFLATKDAEAARNAILLSIAGSLLVLLLYLSVGTLLFVYYKQNPGMALPERSESIFTHFAVTAMPRVMRGLVLTAIVMASIDAPLASLSSAFVTDLRRPFARPPLTKAAELGLARLAAGAFALASAALAVAFAAAPAALSLATKSGAVCAGPLAGVFALGATTARGGDEAAFGAFAAASLLDLGLLALSELGYLPVSWGWITAFGAVAAAAFLWSLARPAKVSASPGR
jgi:Na+/proline symporter